MVPYAEEAVFIHMRCLQTGKERFSSISALQALMELCRFFGVGEQNHSSR